MKMMCAHLRLSKFDFLYLGTYLIGYMYIGTSTCHSIFAACLYVWHFFKQPIMKKYSPNSLAMLSVDWLLSESAEKLRWCRHKCKQCKTEKKYLRTYFRTTKKVRFRIIHVLEHSSQVRFMEIFGKIGNFSILRRRIKQRYYVIRT